MDPRRRLIFPVAILLLGGCAALRGPGLATPGPVTLGAPIAGPGEAPAAPGPVAAAAVPSRTFATMVPVPNPPAASATGRDRIVRRTQSANVTAPPPAVTGRAAIAAANAQARETSRARAFVGGVQVFVYDPGRIYEVWTAPLRVTTLTLSPGETLVSKAAGDTVRWQIGETRSGEGPGQRGHVMIKPLERGLKTNLVLATNRRVYLVQLRSGAPEAFNTAVTWDVGAVLDAGPASEVAPAVPTALAPPQGPLDAGFRIVPKGRRPSWTPQAVMTDGARTFLRFPPGLGAGEAPALFALGPGREVRLINYRQRGDLWVVDQVLDAAELRLGSKRPQVVRIERSAPGRTGGPS